MTLYAWKCNECHHEWQSGITLGGICEWCGADGNCLGEDLSSIPISLLPSHLFKRLIGGMKDI